MLSAPEDRETDAIEDGKDIQKRGHTTVLNEME
jgi:hypothetical protein